MPIKKRITWSTGGRSPFSDPRLAELDRLVPMLRQRRKPDNWKGDKVWENRYGDMPAQPLGHYREFYLGTSAESGTLRLVLGRRGEVYVSGDHHSNWREVIQMPWSPVSW